MGCVDDIVVKVVTRVKYVLRELRRTEWSNAMQGALCNTQQNPPAGLTFYSGIQGFRNGGEKGRGSLVLKKEKGIYKSPFKKKKGGVFFLKQSTKKKMPSLSMASKTIETKKQKRKLLNECVFRLSFTYTLSKKKK